ncbi:MAG TPA: hybrid sensor histidine kinase/response regulator [Oculatellaceae cyanobacterium]|jgi:signal transduction histidine kinase
MNNNFILIVDDEPENFDIIRLLLLKEKYNLHYATGGQEALNILESISPDVILLDVMMPEMDGLEVCKQIKANTNWQHIPIIIVTALNSKEDLARCLDAGADDFLSKPVSGIELRARIRSMLRIKKQYDALQVALESLRSTLNLREDMSRMVVHDLRNPINNIFLFSELLLITELSSQQSQQVEQILIAAQNLRFLTDDLLLMAKVESGKITLNIVDINILDIVQEVVWDFQGLAERKKVQIASIFPQWGKEVFVDVNLCRRVLDNLLSNALKFSPENSEIKVEVEYIDELQKQFIIKVYDQGVGINEDLRQKIFEKYEVGNLMDGISQIGLGLAFCKMAVEAHGGEIFVESNHPQGSVFTVKI